MKVCTDFMVEQDVPDKVASQYVAKCMGTILYDAEQRCSKGVAGFAELIDEQTPGGLNWSNISVWWMLGYSMLRKNLYRKLWTG